mmetsp:Transcript_6787/g.7427  ORF Transcript_6787/g.7427 Transcript_6787/m.7427 type:complete len:168 (+) Transcript_6787:262-765(+)
MYHKKIFSGGGRVGRIKHTSVDAEYHSADKIYAIKRKAKRKTVSAQRRKLPSYILTVIVQQGVNLMAKDSNGLSDPFVKLSVGAIKYKTAIIKKSLNPVWKTAFFTFELEKLVGSLCFTVYDFDNFSRNDFMGEYIIPLEKVRQYQGVRYLHLLSRSGQKKSRIWSA